MNRLILIFILFIVFLITPCCAAYSANSLTIAPKSFSIGEIRADNYEAGYKEKIRANAVIVKDTLNAWKVMIKTNNNNMGVIGSYAKPISDFYWKATGNTATQITYTSIANYDLEIARGSAGASFVTIYMDYKILLSWPNDVPGVYNITVTYTLTTQ